MKMNEMIKCLNSVNLWNWEGLKRKNLEVMCKRLFNQCWFTRKPVIVARCPWERSEDFMTSSNEFYAFPRSTDLQTLAFFWKLIVEQYFKSLSNESNSHESPWISIFDFFQYSPKEVRLLTNLIFFSFGLADDQKSFNAAWKNIFLHFCAAIMDFFIILKC